MLVGLGLSLTSSFVYCVQLLYPPIPLLAILSGAIMISGGALMNVLVARWSYHRFVADWLESWMCRREARRNKTNREELMKEQEVIDDEKMNCLFLIESNQLRNLKHHKSWKICHTNMMLNTFVTFTDVLLMNLLASYYECPNLSHCLTN